MTKLNIKVILGSIRKDRFGDKPAKWIVDMVKKMEDVSVELLDLRNYQLPIFNEPISPSHVKGAYANKDANVWAKKIAAADGFIVVTPEYNHGYPASLKNNIDYIFKEWNKKPVAFVAYGSVGGARAVEQLRQVAVELQMAPIRNSVHINAPWYLVESDGSLKVGALDLYLDAAKNMLSELMWWAKALKTARE